MLNIYVSEKEARGYMSLEFYEKLPISLKAELNSLAFSCEKTNEHISFIFHDVDVADEVSSKVRKFEKSQYRSSYRRDLELTESGGLYEKADIRELYHAQEGKCYYTGECLSWDEKNFSIDHIRPIKNGGNSWPGNLALVLKAANQEKHDMTKTKFLSLLEVRYGVEWSVEQEKFRKKIDIKRQKIDKNRRKTVYSSLKEIESKLSSLFVEHDVSYMLEDDQLVLIADCVWITFPKGFLRKANKAFSIKYLTGILNSIIGKSIN